jgi:hypothetical protein
MASKSGSDFDLTTKLEKTLQKLKDSNYFRDESDSEIPFISTSETFTQEERRRMEFIVNGENFEDINIQELRMFCKSG